MRKMCSKCVDRVESVLYYHKPNLNNIKKPFINILTQTECGAEGRDGS